MVKDANNDPEAEILDYSLVKAKTKSLEVSYLLCIFLGMFGLHHIYLRRLGFGFTYMFTGGLFFMGWIIDIFRLPSLVRSVNDKIIKANRDGVALDQLEKERSLPDACIMCLPPFGLFGFHHFYLQRFGFGVLYFCTLGLFGTGWLLDFFRMPHLVSSINAKHQKILKAMEGADFESGATPMVKRHSRKNLSDGIVFCVGPAGIIGFHHFYLGNLMLGFLYIITLGNCGLCWLTDMFRIREIVQDANNEIDGKPGGQKKNFLQAFLLWLPPAGLLGAHQFYLERPCSGLIRSCTGGLFLIGWLYDLFKISDWVNSHNQKQELQKYMTEVEMEMTSSENFVQKEYNYDPDMVNPFKNCWVKIHLECGIENL